MEQKFLFDELFNPIVSYEGSWLISVKDIVDCAKKENRKKVKEFFQRKLFDKIYQLVDWKPLYDFIQIEGLFLESKHNDNRIGRRLMVDKYFVYTGILQLLGFDNIYEKELDEENLFNSFKEILMQLKRECVDINRNGKNSMYYDKFAQKCSEYNKMRKRNMKVEEFVQILLRALMNLLPKLKYLDDFMERTLDLSEISDYLDLDKFYLLVAKELLDFSKHTVQKVGKIQNSLIFCEKYLEYVRMAIEDNSKYDAWIIKNGKKYHIRDFIKEYERLKFEHPEYKVVRINVAAEDNLEKYHDIDYSHDKAKEKADQFYSEELRAKWEILPKGEVVRTNVKSKSNFGSTERIVKEEGVIKAKSFLDQTSALMIISGINDFEGYVGYVYENGLVIFEKFFEYYIDKDNYRIAVDNATYIMQIDNFVEMTKMAKIDLIRKLKNGEISGLVRIAHDHKNNLRNWQRKILAFIMAGDYELQHEDIYKLVKERMQMDD